MQHHYQDPEGWRAFATMLGVEDDYHALLEARDRDAGKKAEIVPTTPATRVENAETYP
ncbi:hypothetical protein GCM10023183_08870 [Nibribacter koreensis]|uniref:Uncharacterized protein n=1 Tax=Nibribacter koreensis TaxID=1084519 RepID=A0ABP8FBR1_9BACT